MTGPDRAPAFPAPRDGDRHRATGDWDGVLLGAELDAAVAAGPQRLAVVDGEHRLTYAEVGDRVARAAAGLAALGVGRGDVVTWQLPNWWEALVVHHAILRLRAVSNPVMPILRERELTFMLTQSRARVIVVPETFRAFGFAAMAEDLRASVPTLEHVVVVRPAGEDPRDFARLVDEHDPMAADPEATAEDPVVLMYTSGTESVPKGAVHSHVTMRYENRSIRDIYELTGDDIVFMPSPVAHITGLLYGVHLQVLLGTTVVYLDVWDAGRALELIEREGCTFEVGATPFLHGLAHHPDLAKRDISRFRLFACGGADVSPEIVRVATAALDCTVVRVYGSTEFMTASSGVRGDPLDKRAQTDGAIIGNAQARILREDGTEAGPGEVGALRLRGPDGFNGYLDPAVAPGAIDADGWFDSGDLAAIDADGYLTIHGRQKDIIIRGGENLSAKEIEDNVFEHEAVQEVSIVAMPDPVMGERACAFVVAAPGAALTLPDLVAHLEARRIARQKFPERLELVPELPRTATGKIQKFELRRRIAELVAAEREHTTEGDG
ncbi:AMP-binding protein [Baekduia soli]|uniref:AMP-binding protein n=1 Tax=Baekduia soli TaxID=496014 RepID=UPI001E3F3566|nr:AMP-binding protein [Baekduia soli]